LFSCRSSSSFAAAVGADADAAAFGFVFAALPVVCFYVRDMSGGGGGALVRVVFQSLKRAALGKREGVSRETFSKLRVWAVGQFFAE